MLMLITSRKEIILAFRVFFILSIVGLTIHLQVGNQTHVFSDYSLTSLELLERETEVENGVSINPKGEELVNLSLTDTPGDVFLAYSDGKIIRCNTNGGDTTTIYKSPEGYGFIQTMAIDTAGGKLYWVDEVYEFGDMVLLKANLDGTGREVVFNFGFSNTYGIPRAITLDLQNQKVYLIAKKHNIAGADIMRVGLDGGTLEHVFRIEDWNPDNIGGENALKLDLINNKIYLVEEDQDALYRLDLNPATGAVSNLTELFAGKFTRLFDLNLDLREEKIYIADGLTIKVGNLDGTDTLTTLIARGGNITSFSIDLSIPKLFHTEGYPGLNKVSLDGSNSEVIEGLPIYPRTVLVAGEQIAHALASFEFRMQGLTDISKNADIGRCEASLTLPTPIITGAEGNVTITTSLGVQPGTTYTFPLGETQIIYEATDEVTSSMIKDTLIVSVIDNEKPFISCVEDLTLTVEQGVTSLQVTYEDPVVSDNCSEVNLSRVKGLASGTTFPLGLSRVTFQATDSSGNQDTCGFNILITQSTPIGDIYWTQLIEETLGSGRILDAPNKSIFRDNEMAYFLTLDSDDSLIYWSNPSNQTVSRASLDGTFYEEIISPVVGTGFPDVLALDKVNNKLYFHDDNFNEDFNPIDPISGLVRSDLNGSNPELVVNLADYGIDNGVIKSINLDLVHNHLYLTQIKVDDPSQTGIFRFDLNPGTGKASNPKKLFENDIFFPIDIKLDVETGRIFIVENLFQNNDGKLWIGNMDETGPLSLITQKQLIWHLDIDLETELIYYHSAFPYEIRRIGFDGSGDTAIFSFDDILQDFEILSGPLANTTQTSTSPSIKVRTYTDSTTSTDFSFTGSGALGNFSLRSAEEKFLPVLTTGTYTLSLEDLPTWALTDIVIFGDKDSGSIINLGNKSVTIDLDEGEDISVTFIQKTLSYSELFWTYTRISEVRSASITGEGTTTLITKDLSAKSLDIVVDASTQTMYWGDHGLGTQGIHKANFDGANHAIIKERDEDLLVFLRLELDLANQKIYFFDYSGNGETSKFLRMNLDGSEEEVLYNTAEIGINSFFSFQLDLIERYLYVSTNSEVLRFDFDPITGNVGKLVKIPLPESLPKDEVLLELDGINGKMYISGKDNQTDFTKIIKMNVDGTGVETLLEREGNDFWVGDLSVDVVNQHLFYSNRSENTLYSFQEIRRMDLDGTNDTLILKEQGYEGRLATINEPPANTDTITRIKVSNRSNKNTASLFTFSGTQPMGDFQLESNDLEVFPYLNAGSYTVLQATVEGVKLMDIQIEGDTDQGSTVDLVNGTVILDLDENEDILVRFINCLSDTTRIVEQTCNSLEAGIDTLRLSNTFGCDSLVIINTEILPGDTTYLTAITCNPEEVDTSSFTFLNENGCDSILTVYTQLIEEQETVPLSLGDTLVCQNENLLMIARVDSPAFEGNWQIFDDGEWTNLVNEVSDTLFLAAPIPLGDMAYRFWLETICDTVYSDSIVVSSEECERPSVLGYQIVDAIMDTTVFQIDSGATYYLRDLPELVNIEAVADLEINRVVMAMEGPISTGRTERISPYILFDPETGTELAGGTYSIRTIPYYELNKTELPGNPLATTFNIIDCEAEGPLPKAKSRQSISCETDSLILQGEIIGEYIEAYWKGPDGFYSEELTPTVTVEGRYVLTAIGENACVNQEVVMVEPCLEKCELAVEKFVLVNSESDEDIRVLNEGDEIDLSIDGKQLNIRADVVCGPKGKSVRMKLSGAQVKNRIERYNPFALAGDHEGNYFNQFFIPGEYTVTAIPYTETNGKGEIGDSLTINFTVISGVASEQGGFAQPGDLLTEELRLFPNPTERILYLEMLNFAEGIYKAELGSTYPLYKSTILRPLYVINQYQNLTGHKSPGETQVIYSEPSFVSLINGIEIL